MKKRLLFVIPTFEIGGTVVSVKNLLLLLNDDYDITLFCMSGMGTMKGMFDNDKQVCSPFVMKAMTAPSWKRGGTFLGRIGYAMVRTVSKFNIVKHILFRYYAKKFIKSSDYDIVIASEEGICTKFVSFANVKRKIAWVRCDYKKYFDRVSQKSELWYYRQFDNIVCVSQLTSQKFKKCYPTLADNVIAINNPQSSSYILQQSLIDDNDTRFDNNVFTIVSIGRFSPVKRFNCIPAIASFLKEKGAQFKWYIIGGGDDKIEAEIRDKIGHFSLTSNVVMLGVKANPHYYISKADLLVSLSISEACPRVINEAKILHTPVVCTNFDTASEYLINGYDGIISPIDDIQIEILNMIQNEHKYNQIKDRISQFKFDNNNLLIHINELFKSN